MSAVAANHELTKVPHSAHATSTKLSHKLFSHDLKWTKTLAVQVCINCMNIAHDTIRLCRIIPISVGKTDIDALVKASTSSRTLRPRTLSPDTVYIGGHWRCYPCCHSWINVTSHASEKATFQFLYVASVSHSVKEAFSKQLWQLASITAKWQIFHADTIFKFASPQVPTYRERIHFKYENIFNAQGRRM